MTKSGIYNIPHKNGSITRVHIVNKTVTVTIGQSTNHIVFRDVDEIFIGYSTKNDKVAIISGMHGPQYDGNTILIHLGAYTYLYIGSEIYTFDSVDDHEISSYHSPLDKDMIPHAYATDIVGNIYLFVDNVMIHESLNNRYEMTMYGDPYDFYRAYSLMTTNIDGMPPIKPKTNPFDIDFFYVDNKETTLWYSPHAEETYHKLTNKNSIPIIGKFFKKKLFIANNKGKKAQLKKKSFVKMMEEFGTINGFQSFEKLVSFY